MDGGTCGHVSKNAGNSVELLTHKGRMSVCEKCWRAVCRELRRIPDPQVAVPELGAWVNGVDAVAAWYRAPGNRR
jgi:hypothetical protein